MECECNRVIVLLWLFPRSFAASDIPISQARNIFYASIVSLSIASNCFLECKSRCLGNLCPKVDSTADSHLPNYGSNIDNEADGSLSLYMTEIPGFIYAMVSNQTGKSGAPSSRLHSGT